MGGLRPSANAEGAPMPPDHADPLRRTGFPVPDGAALDDAERALLGRYGYWLEALAAGTLSPTTPEQRQFVRVAGGEAEPRSAFEVAWVKARRAAPADPLAVAGLLSHLLDVRATAADLRAEYDARREAILSQVRPQLDALEAEFAGRLAAAAEEVARQEAEAREAVLAHGASFRHAGVNAVFVRGRVTWDGKGLASYAASHPEVEAYKQVGPPSVQLRFDRPREE